MQHFANSVSQIFLPYLLHDHRQNHFFEEKNSQILSSPVIEHFQPVHHSISFPLIIVCCQVVDSTAKFFTCLIIINIGIVVMHFFQHHLKKGVEPVCITTSRCGANKQPIRVHFLNENSNILKHLLKQAFCSTAVYKILIIVRMFDWPPVFQSKRQQQFPG